MFISKKEENNVIFSLIGQTYIEEYLESENVVLNTKMKKYLNTVKAYLRKIQDHYNVKTVSHDKIVEGVRGLKKYSERQSLQAGGESIALTKDDEMLLIMLDTIMFAYSEAVEKSKALAKEVKEYMKMANGNWIGFEKYIVEGAR